MKHRVKNVTSVALAAAMLATSVFSGVGAVFAESEDLVQMETAVEENNIVAGGTLAPEIAVTDDGISVSDVSDAIEIETVEAQTGATVSIQEENISVDHSRLLSVSSFNKSDADRKFRLYFWNGELPEEKENWNFSNPNMDVYLVPESEKLTGELTHRNIVQDVDLHFVEDRTGDDVKARYLLADLPADSSLDFTVRVDADAACDVSVITSVDDALFDGVSLSWDIEDIVMESELETESEMILIEPETNEIVMKDSIVIEGGGTETALESEADVKEHFLETADGIGNLNVSDFASMRLVVLASNPDTMIDPEHVIANYDKIYLLQYGSVEQAMNAYVYYMANADAVEPDTVLEMASEVLSDENIDMDVTEEQNPISALSEEDDSDIVRRTDCVIALIDTGASEGPNVVDRASLIDDVLEGNNSHANDMVAAIVSQNPDAKVLSVRALGNDGRGTVSSIVAAMEYAINQNVSIINLSLYAKTNLLNSVLETEIQKAVSMGIDVVGAAGNDGADVAGYMPGSVRDAWIIGAANEDGSRADFSNYGSTVDYNVIASSTSDAAAKFSGYLSLYGCAGIIENTGIIYSTAYESGADVSIGDGIVINEDDRFDDTEFILSDENVEIPSDSSDKDEFLLHEDRYGLQSGDEFSIYHKTQYYWIEDKDFDYQSFIVESLVEDGETWSYFAGELSYDVDVLSYITYVLIPDDETEDVHYVVVPFAAVEARDDSNVVSDEAASIIMTPLIQRDEFIGVVADKSNETLDGGIMTVEKDSEFNPDFVNLGYDLSKFSVHMEDNGGFDISAEGSYDVLYEVISYQDMSAFWYVKLTIQVVDHLDLNGRVRVVLDWPGIYAVVYFKDGTSESLYYGKSFATDKEIAYIRFGDTDDRTDIRYGAGVELQDADGAVLDASSYELTSDENSFYRLTLFSDNCTWIRLYNTVSDYYDSKGGGFAQEESDVMTAAATSTKQFNGLTYGRVSVNYNAGSYTFTNKSGFLTALNNWLSTYGASYELSDIPSSISIGCADSGAAAYDGSGWNSATITATATISGDTVTKVKLSLWCVSRSAAAYGSPTTDYSHPGWKLGYQRFAGSKSLGKPDVSAQIKIVKYIAGSAAWLQLAEDVIAGKATFGIYTDAACTQLYDTVTLRFSDVGDADGRMGTDTVDVDPGTYWVRETYTVPNCANNLPTIYGPYTVANDDTAVVRDAGYNWVRNLPYTFRLRLKKIDEAGVPVANGIFKVQYRSNSAGAVKWTGYFKTDSNGLLIGDDDHFVPSYKDNNGVTHVSDAPINTSTKYFWFPVGQLIVQEVLAPEGYVLNSTVQILTLSTSKSDETQAHWIYAEDVVEPHIVEPPKYSHIAIKKINAAGGWDDSLKNAQFTLYHGTTALETITITSSALHTFKYDCSLGETYVIRETRTPAGYQTAADISVTIADGSNYKETYSYNIKNLSKPPKVKVTKTSTADSEILNLSSYSREGAEFGIYTDQGCSAANKIGTLKTKADGTTDPFTLSCQAAGTYTYYVREDKAPAGHKQNTAPKAFSVTLPADAGKTIPVEISDDPEFTEHELNVTKLGDKGGPIENAIFKVEYFDAQLADPAKLVKTWYLRSDKDGKVLLDRLHLDPSRRSQSSDFFTWNGEIVIPIGGYLQLTEVEAPAEYIVDDTPMGFLTTKTVNLESKMYNEPEPCEIRLIKYDTNGTTPLAGVEFKLEFVSETVTPTANASPGFTRLLTVGESVTRSTNSNGEIMFENLDQGTYRITEVKTVPGRTLLKDPIEVTLPIRLSQSEIAAQGNVDTSKGKVDPVTGKTFFYECLYEITNTPAFKVPMTGSTGTWKFGYIGIGIAAVVGMVVIMYTDRRRRKRKV